MKLDSRYVFSIQLRDSQRGVTLIVALIFLAMLALFGATAARNSVLEERMAGNTRDRDQAFQAAEAALKTFEKDLEDGVVDTASGYADMSNCVNPNDAGCYLSKANGEAYWNDTSIFPQSDGQWTAGISKLGAGEDGKVNARYIVWKLPDVAGKKRYRVTARGVGQSTDTVVILQAEYSE